MSILITNKADNYHVSLLQIKKFIECCLKTLHLENAEVSLLMTNDREIKELNEKYRFEHKATDILSFSMREHNQLEDPLPPTTELLGDLVVSMDTIDVQAKEKNISLMKELKFILAHGLLHLVGYDHATELDRLRMEQQHHVLMNRCS